MGVRIEGGCSAGVYVEWELKGRSWEIAGDRGGIGLHLGVRTVSV